MAESRPRRNHRPRAGNHRPPPPPWRRSSMPEYVLPDLWEDTQSGHNIVKTVFMECGAEYHRAGPDHLKVVGETEFVRATATASAVPGKAEIAGIVAHANLDMDQGLLKETLQAHETAGDGLFKGIRHGGAHDPGKNLGWMNATLMRICLAATHFGAASPYWVSSATATTPGTTTFKTMPSPIWPSLAAAQPSSSITLALPAVSAILPATWGPCLTNGRRASAAWRSAPTSW